MLEMVLVFQCLVALRPKGDVEERDVPNRGGRPEGALPRNSKCIGTVDEADSRLARRPEPLRHRVRWTHFDLIDGPLTQNT